MNNGLALYGGGGAVLGLLMAKRKGKVASALKWGALAALVAIVAPRFGVALPGLSGVATRT